MSRFGSPIGGSPLGDLRKQFEEEQRLHEVKDFMEGRIPFIPDRSPPEPVQEKKPTLNPDPEPSLEEREAEALKRAKKDWAEGWIKWECCRQKNIVMAQLSQYDNVVRFWEGIGPLPEHEDGTCLNCAMEM